MIGRMARQDVLTLVAAFQAAWLSLLEDEQLETGNIERLPALLMSAILETAAANSGDEEQWVDAALDRLAMYETELKAVSASLAH